MTDQKIVRKIEEGVACVELNDKQKLFYNANAGFWYLQVRSASGSVSTIVLREDILDELYNTAWGDDL